MSELKITYLPIASLKPRSRNPRTHTKKQIRQIADSIKRFGFTNPILVDNDNTIIAGHGRVEAAEILQIETVPVIYLADLSEAEIRAYVIADNKLAENAGWDRDMLAIELQGLLELNLDFDLTITGFEAPEIDILLNSQKPEKADLADQVPQPDDKAPVSRSGDLWLLGRHKLLCGDATKQESFVALLGEEKAEMVFTDPPYNVPIDGHVCGLGKVKHAEFAMASGEMSEAEFVAFLKGVFLNLTAFSSDGSMHFVCMDWRHTFELMSAARAAYDEFKNICVWNKTNGGMGSLYRSKHELVFVFKHGVAPHINNVELGKHGRYRTNVWDYAGVNTFGSERSDLALHPTVKPVSLVADAMLDCSTRGGIVLDCFGGSGTTLIAAEKIGRSARLIEFDPKYVDTIIERYQQFTGDEAVLAHSKASFNDMRDVLA
jgi:DNA modification methylase